MTQSELRLIKNVAEYIPKDDFRTIPRMLRGIYVLYQQRGRKNAKSHHYDVVYIGLATRNIRARLNQHIKSERKSDAWSHFSAFEVWDNVRDDEIEELEGLFRHLYKFDSKANTLNAQKGYRKLFRIRKNTEQLWNL
jgi:hypothetical protein